MVAASLQSKQAGSLKLTDTPQALKFEVKRLPKTSYAKDFLALLRAGSVAPAVIPIFSRVPRSVSKDADFEEEEKGNPGVFRRVFNSALLTGLSILLRGPRGRPGSDTKHLSADAPSKSSKGVSLCPPACSGW